MSNHSFEGIIELFPGEELCPECKGKGLELKPIIKDTIVNYAKEKEKLTGSKKLWVYQNDIK